jgi:hypothetical protein
MLAKNKRANITLPEYIRGSGLHGMLELERA